MDEKTVLYQEMILIVKSNLEFLTDECISDVLDEVTSNVTAWYEGESTYGKPEDILQDYLQFSAMEAHKFLSLFREFSD